MAELHIDRTSETCDRFTLVSEGRIIWRNRVCPTPEAHAGARERMTAWCQAHDVQVQEAPVALFDEPAPVRPPINVSRRGRH